MKYRSTRDPNNHIVSARQAILNGIAPDGGLYVPAEFPVPNFKLEDLPKLSFKQITAMLVSLFFDDFSKQEITTAVANAYSEQWDDRSIVPIEKHNGNFYMELFHGPTLSFEDISLQLLPQLIEDSRQKLMPDHKLLLLASTSGDLGPASMRGFINQDAEVFALYPENIGAVQIRQMLLLRGDHLHPLAISGDFANAQTTASSLLRDNDFKQLLANNSVLLTTGGGLNIAHLIAQISYYLYAYGQLVRRREVKLGDPVNFAVPTGSGSDLLAGYYAKKLGVPVGKLLCVGNDNRVLADFIEHGNFDKRRKLRSTSLPALDIVLPDNLERLLYALVDEDSAQSAFLMNQLIQRGHYQVSADSLKKLQETFVEDFAQRRQIISEIKRVYNYDRYVIDPYTAASSFVANKYQKETGDSAPMVIVSTASPYKSPELVYEALIERKCPNVGAPAIRKLHEELGGNLPIGVRSLFDRDPGEEAVLDASSLKPLITQQLAIEDD